MAAWSVQFTSFSLLQCSQAIRLQGMERDSEGPAKRPKPNFKNILDEQSEKLGISSQTLNQKHFRYVYVQRYRSQRNSLYLVFYIGSPLQMALI